MIGRLASDPTAGQTQNGKSKSSFRIAVPRQFKKSEADFFMVVAFNNTADFVNSYLTKGRMVALDGSIQNRSYQAQDGSKKYVTEILANSVEALGKGNEGGTAQQDAPQVPDEFLEVDTPPDLPFL